MITELHRTSRERVDRMLDLQAVPAAERWGYIQAAMDLLEDERGASWRLKVLLRDAPEEASRLPPLVNRLRLAGMRFDVVREQGGVQSLHIGPGRGAFHALRTLQPLAA